MDELITLKSGEIIYIERLTEKTAYEYCEPIINLANIIPYIKWNKADLLSQDEDYYHNKWNYSYIIKNNEAQIIGILIAYFRISDEKHIFDSLYIHRLAICRKYQSIGIGTAAIQYFIEKSFSEIPWLLNVSVQTNDNINNSAVIRFYENIGFIKTYNITYPEKKDILFLYERKNHNVTIEKHFSSLCLNHPRLSLHVEGDNGKDILPVIYFSSTNEKKRQIVEFIFNNYNIDIKFVKAPIELIEPQIEGTELEEEKKLVSLPLKNISRFITSVPYVIEDTMLFVEYFNRNGEKWELPGLDTKRWLRQIGLQGMLDIMGNTTKRNAKFVSQTGAYIKSSNYCFGRGEITGTIARQVAKVTEHQYGTYPYFFHLIFIPDGATKTLAEMDMYEYAKYDYMRKGIRQMIDSISKTGGLQREYTLFDYIGE